MFSFQLPKSNAEPQGSTSIFNDLPLNPQKELVIGKFKVNCILGVGSFAQVYRAIQIDSGKQVALKIINMQALQKKYSNLDDRQKLITALANEQTNLAKCHSAHIIKLYDTIQEQSYKVYVLQYCNQGTLQSLLRKRGCIEEINAVQILKQILFGLAEMHRNGIIHRDLKPANIFIHNGLIKIGDLGFSKEIPVGQISIHTYVGSRSTMAPEVVNREPYGLKADIWSVGVIFWLLLWYDIEEDYSQNLKNLQKFIFQKEKMKSSLFSCATISPEAKDFLIRALQVDQSKRLDWQRTLNHPLFQQKFEALPQVFIPHLQQQFRQLSCINSSEILEKPEQVNPEESYDLQILNKQYLECRKAEYLMTNLIDPLDSKHLLDNREQRHVELIHLLLVRCSTNVSKALQEVKQNYPIKVWDALRTRVCELQERIRLKFNSYSQLLHSYESKVSTIIKDKFSKLLNKASFNQKEKFLNGLEGLDFTRAEQIDFTYERYIVDLINEIKGNPKDEELLKAVLRNYRCIAKITPEQVAGTSLATLITRIIKSEIVIDCK